MKNKFAKAISHSKLKRALDFKKIDEVDVLKAIREEYIYAVDDEGRTQGPWIYLVNGLLKEKKNYIDDEVDGVSEYYYSGTVNLLYRSTHKSGKCVSSTQWYTDKFIGACDFALNGLNYTVDWYESGNISGIHIVDGNYVETGLQVSYIDRLDDAVESIEDYCDGAKHGESIFYFQEHQYEVFIKNKQVFQSEKIPSEEERLMLALTYGFKTIDTNKYKMISSVLHQNEPDTYYSEEIKQTAISFLK